MDYYRLLRPFLFSLEAEQAHHLALYALKYGLIPPQPAVETPTLQTQCFGLNFSNPIGLAAGFDKDAEAIKTLSRQGFGFLELGTVTPAPQPGNAKPRLFRLPEDRAVINRFGFNSKGLDSFVKNLKQADAPVPIGGNIGKNKTSTDALADYRAGMTQLYPFVDYITVNISSPNTAGLRDLQAKEALQELLSGLCETKKILAAQQGVSKPLLLKIAPDLSSQETESVIEVVLAQEIDGLIVSNTTITRPDFLQNMHKAETGGLSGAPLKAPALGMLKRIYRLTNGQLPLIGVGGISSGKDAYERLRAGASLLQLYSALVYEGFSLVTRIKRELQILLERDGVTNMQEIIGLDSHT